MNWRPRHPGSCWGHARPWFPYSFRRSQNASCARRGRGVDPGMKRTVIFALVAAVGWAAPDWQQQLPPEEFAQLPEVQAVIDFARFDQSLMVAAIFHETNRVRRQLGLVPFTHLAKLDQAADLKAAIGVMQGELSHHNPMPLTATPADRVRAVGLSYRVVAENIARLGILDLPAGTTQVGVRKREGRDEYYHLDSKRTVGPRTYAGFAAMVVQAWMNSPSHRANIVNPEFLSLGCGARTCRDLANRHEQVYATQVFFTPR